MAIRGVNLLQTKSDLHPILQYVEKYIHIVSLTLLGIFVSTGLVLLLAYTLLTQRQQALTTTKSQLMRDVEAQVQKESLITVIKNRVGSIETIMKNQTSYTPFIDTTLQVIKSYTLSSFALGEKNTVTITLQIQRVEEAMDVLATVMTMVERRIIINPVLQSFILNEKGGMEMGLSYTVVL